MYVVEVQIGDAVVEAYDFEEFEERVADGRIPDSAQIRFGPVTGDSFELASTLDLYTSIRDGSAVAWQVRFRNSGPPILTALLVGLQVRIWLWAQLPEVRGPLVNGGVNWMSPALENGEPWRLITYGLLHTDFLHILLNMVWMTYTGWNIERALGRRNLAAIFFFSVVAGGLLSMFFTPGVPSLGASGGVYGLVSASVVFGFIRQDLLPESGRRLFGAALAPYLVLMFLSGLSNAQTDNWAHFGGLVMGAFLALVLDPPSFERRPRQNAMVQAIGTVSIAALLLVFGIAGPRLYPLVDKDQARIDALPAASRARALQNTGLLLTDLTWAVPAGWKTGSNPAGDLAFVSPVKGQDRSYTLVQNEHNEPATIRATFEDWTAAVRRGHPDAEIMERQATSWLGRPANEVLAARVILPSSDGRILEWIGTRRGVYTLYRVLEVEPEMEGRLRPLFDRIDTTIDWREPLELQAARRNVHATPRGVKARREAALALAKWGEADEAQAIARQLTTERPEDGARWVQRLSLAQWFSDDPVPLVDEALAAAPDNDVVVAAADLLFERGESDAAAGLLQLVWARAPGERAIKRALRRRGLRWTLTEVGVPTQVAFLPNAELRSIEGVDALLEAPLTVESAAHWGRFIRLEREALAATFSAADAEGQGVDLLLRVRDGGFERVFDNQKLLRRELLAASEGRPAQWMVAPLPELLTAEVVERLRAELAPPTED